MRPLFRQLEPSARECFLLGIELPQKYDASTFYGPIHMCSIYVPKAIPTTSIRCIKLNTLFLQ
jgi:hypothetical protein